MALLRALVRALIRVKALCEVVVLELLQAIARVCAWKLTATGADEYCREAPHDLRLVEAFPTLVQSRNARVLGKAPSSPAHADGRSARGADEAPRQQGAFPARWLGIKAQDNGHGDLADRAEAARSSRVTEPRAQKALDMIDPPTRWEACSQQYESQMLALFS
jgi:hypothetical protein